MKAASAKQGMASALFNKSSKRLRYGFYFLLSITLIVLARLDHPVIKDINNGISFVVSPAIIFFNQVSTATSDTISWVQGLAALEAENERLLEENSRLQKWRFAAERLNMENQRLQELLNVRPTFVPTLVTARVIAVTGGAYAKSVLVHAGDDDGVRVDLPVVDENGLVGRTIQVSDRATRVLLTTDLNSRIPVQIERTKQNLIVVGRNDDLLEMIFSQPDPDIAIGDKVVTSGHGGMFPADIVVGEVVDIQGETVLILPAANLENLDFVRVLDFNPRELEPVAGD